MSESEKDVYQYQDVKKKRLTKPVLIATAAGVLGVGFIAATAIGFSSIGPNSNIMQGKPPQSQFEQRPNRQNPEQFSPEGDDAFGSRGDEDGRDHQEFDDRDGYHGDRGEGFGQGHKDDDLDSEGQFETNENS